jgi:hypothetical protein
MTAPLQYAIDWDRKLPPEAQRGMAQCDSNADFRWKRWVDGAIQAAAKSHEFFTVDEVLAELESLPNPPGTHNLAALGPRMKEVSKVLKYMTATHEVRRSKRPEKHGNLMRIWKSNLYKGVSVPTVDPYNEMPHEAAK